MANPIYQTVIVGGGFAGLFTALHLSHHSYPRSVILIDQNERFCFKPLLYEYFDGEMEPNQVVPRYEELLRHSGVIFMQDTVKKIDLHQRRVELISGDQVVYSNLVLALGSVTGYFGVEGAKENALPFRTQQDAISLDHHIHDRLEQASQTLNLNHRRRLLTFVVVGAGPSGVEIAATLADLLPEWYSALGGNDREIRVVLLSHGQELLKGDINSQLRELAEQTLNQKAVSVELLLGSAATKIRPDAVEYKRGNQTETLAAGTTIWTSGTADHPLVKVLPIPDEHRDSHHRPFVTPTLQLLDFPEVFAGGDCVAVKDQSLPPTAQVAYQQGAAIAYNLRALALGYELKPAHVTIRGTLLKLGLKNGVANLFNEFEITGEIGHLIRQGTYLELLPTPVHNFKATQEWLKQEAFQRHLGGDGLKQTIQVAEVVGGVVVGAIVARKLLKRLNHDSSL